NLGYPQRAIRTSQNLYIRNFKPERWPSGDPPEFHDIDQASERFTIRHGDDPRYAEFFRLITDRRPAEELYDILADPACLHNLAGSARYEAALNHLRGRLGAYLMQTQDPRVTGNGEIFESHPRLVGPMRKFPPDTLWENRTGSERNSPLASSPVPSMRLVLIHLLLLVSQTVWSQTGPQQLFVLPDTVLQGPAPTDTTRNAVNGFLRDFYRDYPTDFDYFRIPSDPLSSYAAPGLDFRHRK